MRKLIALSFMTASSVIKEARRARGAVQTGRGAGEHIWTASLVETRWECFALDQCDQPRARAALHTLETLNLRTNLRALSLVALAEILPNGNKSLFTGSYDTLFHLVLLRESFIMLMANAVRENPHGIQGFSAEIERALRYFSQHER